MCLNISNLQYMSQVTLVTYMCQLSNLYDLSQATLVTYIYSYVSISETLRYVPTYANTYL
jgi:hypothetical protein